MFKLKAGNVFEKINNMDRKQAYTIGAVVAVLIVALLLIGSLMGTADDSSLNDFQARGYDLAAMPFINDEAEQLLLSSKYPDMQGDGSSLLFSQQEKEERQEADGADEDGEDEEEFDEDGDDDESGSSAGASAGGRSGGGYGGRGGGAGRGKTEVGRLGGASMGRSGGSGMSGSYGAPRGDYSQYKTQNKGKEKPIEFKNQDARRALSQFAKGSRAAAGLRDGKLANAKRALQGGDILGSEAFAGNGVDLSKTNGLALDTNAPIGSNPDLSNLKDKVANEAKKADDKQKEKNKEKEKGFFDKLLSAVGDAMINSIANGVGDLMSAGWNKLTGGIAGNIERGEYFTNMADHMATASYNQYSDAEKQALIDVFHFTADDGSRIRSVEELDAYFSGSNGQLASVPVFQLSQMSGTSRTDTNFYGEAQDSQVLTLGATKGDIRGAIKNYVKENPTSAMGKGAQEAYNRGFDRRVSKNGNKDYVGNRNNNNGGDNGGSRSWTEYDACKNNNGRNCDQYKPN